MLVTVGEVRTNSKAMFFKGLLHIDALVKIYISCIRTLDAVKRTYQEWWKTGTDSERESRDFLLSDNDDDDHLSEE